MRRSIPVGVETESPLLALTVLQPFATAIVSTDPHAKRCENRTWARTYPAGGMWAAIHAGKGPYVKTGSEWTALLDDLKRRTGWDAWLRPPGEGIRMYPRGVLLGMARFVRCEPVERRRWDPWAVGPFCHVIDEVRVLPTAIPCQGALGFWRVPDEHVPALRALVAA